MREAFGGELANFADGRLTAELYAPEFAKLLVPTLPAQEAGLNPEGKFEQMALMREPSIDD